MKSSIFVENPERQEFTLAATMSLREWKIVRRELEDSDKYEAKCFVDHIRKLVGEAEKQFDAYSAPESTDG
jgi:dsRNA-specific ribonuclease